jgi:CubicO group peptidase (beta-lactamase class C family)
MKYAYVFAAILLATPQWVAAQVPPSNRAADTVSVAGRIAEVESALLPPVTIAGRTAGMGISSRMEFYRVPGVSVAVINNGVLEWARAYGVKDVSTSEPVTTETLFQAASISKPLTAMAVLSLVREGRIALDVDINSLLMSWKIPENEFTAGRKVTLRDILSHRSGLTNSIGAYASDERQLPTLIEALNGASPLKPRAVRVEFVPGSRVEYSGGAFTVLQVLLEDVTGQPFDEFMRDAVLTPLGMVHSFFNQPLPRELAGFAATAHGPDGSVHPGRWRVLTESAAGGLWSTPSDIARFVLELQEAVRGRSDRILDSQLAGQMVAPRGGRWGLGIAVGGEGVTRHFTHVGWNRGGFRSLLIGFLDTGQGAVIMTNGESNSTEFIDELVRSIAQVYDWPILRSRVRSLSAADTAIYRQYVGQYEFEPGHYFTVTAADSKLFISGGPFGNRPVELYPESTDTYFVLTTDVAFTFRRSANGQVSEMLIQPPGESRIARKVR